MQPLEITKLSPTEVKIVWQEDEFIYPVLYLRLHCTCASCIDELTGKRTLRAESVPADIQVLDAKLVGNYAIRFFFSDHHNTGIYTWKYLYDIAPRQQKSP
ncbi:MAG: DUF971 domain-containing protein [Acidobacteriota bacterium]|nr:DUF971 domain-containing protein [Blastocatellia bacterium]MDW8411750.1 DUF971 domain-containing protein [Acidobacteriota bacterium]